MVSVMGSNKNAFADNSCLEDRIKKRVASGVIMIYVFDGETLKNKPLDIKANMYLYRYDLRVEQLEQRSWQIQYNGEQKN